MKIRIARKIVKAQEIRCRSRFSGPENIRTAGYSLHPEEKFQKALRALLRKLDREAARPTRGAIERCADIYREMTSLRLNHLIQINVDLDWSPAPMPIEKAEAAK